MQFAILGQTSVISDGKRIPVSRTKRRVLSALLIAGDEGMSGEALVAAVWGDAHDRDNSLKSCISLIRRIVGPDRLPSGDARGYRFCLQPGDTFDVATFRNLVGDAARLTAAGDHTAAQVLQKALALWSHNPLTDLPEESADLRATREELLFERRAAQTTLFRLQIDLGQSQSIVADLRRELAHDPLSEEWHYLLMRALAAAGHQSESLRHFDAACEVFLRETGGRPGQRLQQLRDEIDARGADVPPTAAPPAAPPMAAPAQLPADLLDFTGREQEVDRLVKLLTPPKDATGVPVLGISGLPGAGKTTLAVHIAHLLRPKFPDGQLFVQLASGGGAPKIGEMLAELLDSLGVPAQNLPASTAGRAKLLRSTIADRRVLVLVDDAASASQASNFLPGTAGCAVIITSRAVLTGPGIRSFPLGPLCDEESKSFLEGVIGADRIEREPAAAENVLNACGGLPLALRIAGSRLLAHPHWPIEFLAARLQDRLKGLADGDLAVEASIAESYEALPEAAQHAFRVLALAGPGDWPMWLASMLLGAEEADNALAVLTSHSLLSPAGADTLGHPRYRQHDLVRDFAEDRLHEHVDERDITMNRLLLGWLLLADRAAAAIPSEPFFPPPARLNRNLHVPAQALRLIDADPDGWLTGECAQLLAVIRVACEENRYRQGYGIALRLASYLYRAGRDRDAENMWRVIMRTADAAEDDRIAAEARHRVAALIARGPDGPSRAIPMLDLCVATFEELVDRQPWARALALRAFCFYKLAGPLERAVQDATQALELARLMEDRYGELVCLRTLGLVAAADGRLSEGTAQCEAALALGKALTEASGDAAYEVFAAAALARVTAGEKLSPM